MSSPQVNSPKPVVYPAYVEWNSFSADELEQIDMAVMLLKDYVLERKMRPEVSFIKNMFLDDFDGFEDCTPEMAVAITEKLVAIWEDGNETSSTQRTHEEKCADNILMTFPHGIDQDLSNKVKIEAEKLAKYMGKTDTGDYTLINDCPDEAYEILFNIEGYRSEAIGVSMFNSISDDASGILDKVNDILLSYIFTFKNQRFFEKQRELVSDALVQNNGYGTAIFSAKTALEMMFKENNIEKFDVSIYPMDFVPGFPVGATVTASWIEDDVFKSKTAYGHFREYISQ